MRPLPGLFRRTRIEAEMDEELRAHVACRADDLERSGLARDEAERRARLEFGSHEGFKEECRESLGGHFIDTLIRDVRYSARVLRKSPGFTAVAIVTLALAIGANAVVFGILNGVLLRPLNLPREDSLYSVQRSSGWGYQSYPDYVDYRDRNRSMEGLAAYNIDAAGLDSGEGPVRAWVYEVSGNYFDVLGLQPYLGRFLHGSDERGPDSAPYIVLSYAYWHSHFHDDRGVVGRSVRLSRHPFTVIGVAPPGFRGTLQFFSPDLFVPIVNAGQIGGSDLKARGNRWVLDTIGHTKPGVTPAQAAADLNSVALWLEKTYPKDNGKVVLSLARPGLVGDFLARPARAFVTALMMLAGLILLGACANLGSLFAARAADRSREVALRLALGARRSRVLRQLLTEALLISLLGGAAGIVGSNFLLRLLSTWQPMPKFPIQIPVYPDVKVYGVAFALAVLSGILFGIVPVRQVLRTDPYEIVKAGSKVTGGRRITVRDALLVVQVAICAVLVTSSFVAARGLARSMYANFGFEPEKAMLVDANVAMAGYSGDRIPVMQKRIVDALKTIPGVNSVGLVDNPPLLEGWMITSVFTDKTTDLRPDNAAAEVVWYNVSPSYFEAAGTALLAGRTFTEHDDKDSPRVAIVNPEFARRVLGSESDAVGRYFKRRDGKPIQVVGLTGQGQYTTNVAEKPQAAMFLPILQSPTSNTWLIVRSARDPAQLAAAIRGTLRDVDRELPVFTQTWRQGMDGALFASRVATVSLGVMGLLGAMLAVTGIFGMAAYSVSKRLHELGIRMALGARRSEVLRTGLGRALKVLALGSTAGVALGILSTKVLAAIVYQATPRDPLVLAGVLLAMIFLGLLATWIPAQRALSLDPVRLLREE